jgi:hypothetical protein
MKWVAIGSVFWLATVSTAVAEDFLAKLPKIQTAKGFVEYYRTRKDPLAKFYVKGLIDGIGDMNAQMSIRTGHYLFCEPEKVAMVEDQLMSIVEDYIERVKKAGGFPISAVAVQALTDVFPCGKS